MFKNIVNMFETSMGCLMMDPLAKKILSDQKLECGKDYTHDRHHGVIDFKEPVSIYCSTTSNPTPSEKPDDCDMFFRPIEIHQFHVVEYKISKFQFMGDLKNNPGILAYDAELVNVTPPIIKSSEYPNAVQQIGHVDKKLYVFGDFFNKDRFQNIGTTISIAKSYEAPSGVTKVTKVMNT